jgi:nucleoside-diphosphate-sugar epimerase
MTRRKALLVGATGVVGRNLLRHLLADGCWDVVTVSRRTPEVEGRYEHLNVDLLDARACSETLGVLDDITHVFYEAWIAKPDLGEMARLNLTMLRNVVEPVEAASPALEHIHVTHGTKWYGSHLGPFRTPAREDDPRHAGPNFYYDQWDYLLARQHGKLWSCSSARPHGVSGFAWGNPSNLTMVLGVYACITRELGLPLCHPGTEGNYRALYQCTDSGLLARAIVWMSTSPQCANEAFNITNGELIRWENVWPRIARYWDMEAGPRREINMVSEMADKGPVWDRIVARHGLQSYRYQDIVSWGYGDFVFKPTYDIISSTTKARRYGFNEVVDTEEMFCRLWNEMKADRLLPP